MQLLALVCALAVVANAATEEISLKQKIAQSLEASLEQQVSVSGIENCGNKCNKVFQMFAYLVATDGNPNSTTFEYQACLKGCGQCEDDLKTNANHANCFTTCKDFDWKGNGILKGVIEPDKACIAGCIIQTCQVICADGTVDPPNKSNKKLFYPNGGCSIKTGSYSQYQDYVFWNSPNTGQGGSSAVAQCCSNSLSLCQYVGDKSSSNYKQLLANTQGFCKSFVSAPRDEQQLCDFYNKPQNCGKGT